MREPTRSAEPVRLPSPPGFAARALAPNGHGLRPARLPDSNAPLPVPWFRIMARTRRGETRPDSPAPGARARTLNHPRTARAADRIRQKKPSRDLELE